MIAKKRKKEKESISSFVFLSVLAFLAFVVAIVFVYKNINLYQYRSDLSQKVEELKKESEALKEKEESFKEGLSEEEWQDFVEQEARGRLNLQKEGEEVVSFVLPEIEEEEEELEEEKRSPWHPVSWWEWVKNIF